MMSHVRSANFRHGIVVHLNYTVEVVGNDFGYVMEPIEVVLANGGRAREVRLQTAISSGEEYSMISVQRLEDFDDAKVLLTLSEKSSSSQDQKA
jgi:hypothetical protein